MMRWLPNPCSARTTRCLLVTPGSGAAHLGLFGFDPVKYEIGRGVLSALGVDFDLQKGDVAARGNFCTVDSEGVITDARAPARIPTEVGEKLSSC
jgi:2,3-bisphosphoglycerate-independent phosphoglycerate mutase